ncbi:biotin/lipoyl-binding protein [Paenibacillus polymyxa]|uniref:Biotin/lipoyl-binding protein n=1 Tax=Paenibacillus polymyxa TaxID=1406 RepID=A0A8I1IVI7_PAEPO|nr:MULTISPECIES: biotin/lipoyl-binding protein [Paenibacillus]KAF6572885.1 biotin/lipoyl-binding protein [Paenibacillus sp. EKM206P]KAF6587651.1 biotin/lipoyl-binding protein [Paenibacillus sp. EKM205P]MBM0633843.1 biotin/lipoyl-binding protein [Paenibacillus polymyxa]
MNKKIIVYVLLVVALGTGGTLMAMSGKDAVSMAAQQKNTLLTADTVNVAFQGVGGRVNTIEVKEEQQVKKGDVLMTLDPVDLDLQIEKLKTDIAQADVKIKQAKDGLQNQSEKISTSEKQGQLDIQAAQAGESLLNQGTRAEDILRQKLAIEAAQQSLDAALTGVETAKRNAEIAQKTVSSRQQALDLANVNYNRIKALYDGGAGTKAELDNAKNQLDNAQIALDTATDQVEIAKNQIIAASKQSDIAKNGIAQQQTALDKMEAGATAEERQQARIKTEKAKEALTQTSQTRKDVKNSEYNVDLLAQQKQALSVQLKTLELQRGRMVLKASADGKVSRIVPKMGEIVSTGATGVVIETNQLYYDIYVGEDSMSQFKAGGNVNTHVVALDKDVQGKVRYITSAPQYTNMRMSRDKGLSDISSFQVRVDVQRTSELLPGMTVEVVTK